MAAIAFHAPLKAPTHPVPSGDRAMARAILGALGRNPAGWRAALVSEFRSFEGRGDPERQAALAAAAADEARRLTATGAAAGWRAWVTYHCHYKAPDLIGPAVAARLGIPYLAIEATRARKRLGGPWDLFARHAEAACDAAATILWLTARDRVALAAARPARQRLVRLRPFLDRDSVGAPAPLRGAGPPRLIAVGMMRAGDKLASYAAMAAALARARCDWRLEIAGDGPAAAGVAALFAPFGARVRRLGQLDPVALEAAYARADLMVWPGVNEAYGIVYLEAQAAGLPVVAENRPGVRDVVRAGGLLVPAGDATALAAAIDRLAGDDAVRRALGAAGRAQVAAEHLRPAAAARLWREVARAVARTAGAPAGRGAAR
jgi:glycosyltransferase involved in cell wall biosynthesis